MKQSNNISIDLAKSVLQVAILNHHGKVLTKVSEFKRGKKRVLILNDVIL